MNIFKVHETTNYHHDKGKLLPAWWVGVYRDDNTNDVMGYLQVDGKIIHHCANGWFESEEAAYAAIGRYHAQKKVEQVVNITIPKNCTQVNLKIER